MEQKLMVGLGSTPESVVDLAWPSVAPAHALVRTRAVAARAKGEDFKQVSEEHLAAYDPSRTQVRRSGYA